MKLRFLMLVATAGLGLAGCSTDQGGTGPAPVEYSNGGALGESHPIPAGSPTWRPGMNPQDPRDSQFTTRPGPELNQR